jgi:hypothetical protein
MSWENSSSRADLRLVRVISLSVVSGEPIPFCRTE